jgi:hypothetical protein
MYWEQFGNIFNDISNYLEVHNGNNSGTLMIKN